MLLCRPAKLRYECHGSPSLPPLVLLHGFLGCKADWLGLMPALIEHFYCITLDLPAHGDHQLDTTAIDHIKVAGFSYCVQSLIEQLDALNLAEFHLYGYSLGGRIALHLAKAYPQRLLSLTLESCHPGLHEPKVKQSRAASDAVWAERLIQLSAVEFLTLWYQQAVFASLTSTERHYLIKLRAKQLAGGSPEALLHMYDATGLARQDNLWQVPSLLECECHLVVGSLDSKFVALAKQWQQIARIQVCEVVGVSHNVHMAHPDAVIERLMLNYVEHWATDARLT